MPNKGYLKGRAFEYDMKKLLEREGYVVTRAAGSHGPHDLIATRTTNQTEYTIYFMQLKAKRI